MSDTKERERNNMRRRLMYNLIRHAAIDFRFGDLDAALIRSTQAAELAEQVGCDSAYTFALALGCMTSAHLQRISGTGAHDE